MADLGAFQVGLRAVTASVFLVSGVWLCVLRPLSARHGGLGLFLFFSAFVAVFVTINAWAIARGDLGLAVAARRGQQLATFGADLAIVAFVLHYPRVRWPLRPRVWTSRIVIALAFGLLFLVALFPQAYRRTLLVGGELVERDGPLLALVAFPTFIVIAAMLIHDYVREPRGGRRRSILLVSLGLLLYRVPVTAREIASWDPSAFDPIVVPSWRPLAGAVALAIILALLAWAAARPRVPSNGPARLLVLTVALALVGVASVWFPDRTFFQLLFDLGPLAFGLLALYGILRGEILNLDATVQLGIRRSTLAAMLLAAYFIVAQIVESYFSNTVGIVAGGLAAGTLLLASTPLQRIADRVATSAAPADPVGTLPREARLGLYRDAARDAWADGTLGQGERRMLQGLRAKLGIDAEDALRVEAEAAEKAP